MSACAHLSDDTILGLHHRLQYSRSYADKMKRKNVNVDVSVMREKPNSPPRSKENDSVADRKRDEQRMMLRLTHGPLYQTLPYAGNP